MTDTLTTTEKTTLKEREETIASGLQTFVEVGRALCDIRDGKLYRASHETFEAYCQDRWQMARRTAYQIIGGADVYENLSANGAQKVLPKNERQTRPLASLPPAKQGKAWEKAVDSANGKQPTAKQVEEAAVAVVSKSKKQAASNGRRVTPDADRTPDYEDESQEAPEPAAPAGNGKLDEFFQDGTDDAPGASAPAPSATPKPVVVSSKVVSGPAVAPPPHVLKYDRDVHLSLDTPGGEHCQWNPLILDRAGQMALTTGTILDLIEGDIPAFLFERKGTRYVALVVAVEA